jgi:hypothetical protein
MVGGQFIILKRICTNGPAIWGGCVTRRSTGHDPDTLASKLSRCKEGTSLISGTNLSRCNKCYK